MKSEKAPMGADIITQAINQIEEKVVRVAAETGTTIEWYLASELRKAMSGKAKEGELMGAVLSLMAQGATIRVDKVRGVWGMRYANNSLLRSQPGPKSPVLLRDAPLAARKSFLVQATDFRKDFMEKVGQRREALTAARSREQQELEIAQALALNAVSAFNDI